MTRLAVSREPGGKAAAVYEHLKEAAVAGRLRPAHQLIPGYWAKIFGVSETPIREALARLAAEGFVDWRRSHGYYSKVFTEVEQRELHEFAMALLTSSMVALRPDRSAGILETLANLDPSAAEGPGGAGYATAHVEELYVGLAEATGSTIRLNATRTVVERTHLVRLIDFQQPETAVTAVEHLRRVGRALLDQDPASAQALTVPSLQRRVGRLAHLVGEANARAAEASVP